MLKKRLTTAGLVALLLADVALVALALRAPEAAPAAPSASSTQGTAGSDTTTATSTPKSSSRPAYEPHPLTLMVVGAGERRAWRTSSGSCLEGGAFVQTTSDGGKSWTKKASPSGAIARAQPLSGSRGFVYGAGKGCALREYVTTDGGTTWQETQAVAGVWSRSVQDGREVSTPADTQSRPCGDQAVIDLLRTSSTGARALCLDGTMRRTSDAGAKWVDAGTVPGGLALSGRVEGDTFAVYAARASNKCEGVEIASVGEAKPDPVACVKTDTEAAPGEIDLSTPAEAGWLVVGGETWTSTNLTSWNRA